MSIFTATVTAAIDAGAASVGHINGQSVREFQPDSNFNFEIKATKDGLVLYYYIPVHGQHSITVFSQGAQ